MAAFYQLSIGQHQPRDGGMHTTLKPEARRALTEVRAWKASMQWFSRSSWLAAVPLSTFSFASRNLSNTCTATRLTRGIANALTEVKAGASAVVLLVILDWQPSVFLFNCLQMIYLPRTDRCLSAVLG